MSTETTSEKDSLELAKDAINYVLQRIKKDENIRYHMGALTESFERLKAAHSALTGIAEETIEEAVFGRELTRKPFAVQVAEIREVLNKEGHPQYSITAIKEIVGM